MDSYEKVYPTVEELCKVNNNISCPECSVVFKSDSNLNLHLAKTHKKSHLLQQSNSNANKVYFCPIVSCNYSREAHFKQLNFLKQHYLKVHSEKSFICKLCQKGFSTEAFRNRHLEYCNVIFKCCDCDVSYNCYETLKTHSRRKKHNILEKVAYKTSTTILQIMNSKSDISVPSNKIQLLLPKPSSSAGVIPVVSNTAEQESQTDVEHTKYTNQESQTILTTKIPQLSVETQTIGDYLVRQTDYYSNVLKSITTQTPPIDPKTVSCNTLFNLDEFGITVSDVERNSSSTQTAVYNDLDYVHSPTTSTTHTDTSDLLTKTLDANFFNCNTETQTDFKFLDDLFKYCDDYTNMYTQTCEDLFMGEMSFNDTQTQTVFDDMSKSVESQTIMSQSKKVTLGCEDINHMETQTDMHFKEMLEEINA